MLRVYIINGDKTALPGEHRERDNDLQAMDRWLASECRESYTASAISTRRRDPPVSRRHGEMMRHSTIRTEIVMRTGITMPQLGRRSRYATLFIAAGAFAILCGVGGSRVALAASPQAGNVDELRPLHANAMDVDEGRRLAQTTCSKCHGAEGISATAGVPNLAGQRPAYIFRELRAYVSGARNNNTMNGAIRFLSIDALVDVAAYYATLEPAQPTSTSETKDEADPMLAGKAAAAGCAGCHGEIGVSQTPGVPSLVGQDPKYLVAAMGAYKGSQRKNDIMKAMIGSVPDASMNNIAMFYALQKPSRTKNAVTGNAKTGEALAAGCAGCHGAKGVSGNPSTPSLAGQDAQYLTAALHGYKSGTRSDATMKGLAAGLDESGIKNVTAYYASLQPQQPNVSRPLSTAQWVERCNRCHGVNGNSTNPSRPALAGQRMDYLQKVLTAYRTGARRSPEMAAMADVLSEDDVRNLAAYYAHQRARAVVYVPIPTK